MLQRDVEFAEDSFIIVDGYSKWEGARRERERLGSSYAKNCYSSSNSTIKMIISTSHSLKTIGCSYCHYSEKIYLKKRKTFRCLPTSCAKIDKSKRKALSKTF